MKNALRSGILLCLLSLMIVVKAIGGNTPCTATPISNNMTSFETYSNLTNPGSGEPDPGCGNYIFADFWFSTTVPPSGVLNIATMAGGLVDGAMAVYDGSCSSLNQLLCTEDDNCGNTIMPVVNLEGLTPGTQIYIRIWAEGGGPNGTFEIRVSDGPISTPPLPTTSTVGSAQYTEEDCVQLTIETPGQSGCAWDPVQIDMNQPFDQSFNFNFGTSDAGADGICLVFHDNPSGLGTCGNTGQNIAADFNNSFIIEFDTYDNGPGFSDIPNDHVSINVNGNMGGAINGPSDLGNIEDGQEHEVRFVWDPTTNFYEVYFDGNLTLSGTYDIINNCLGGNPFCYWGFTGSTGGAVNLQTVCPVDVPEFPAGSLETVEVEICEGESYYAGGQNQTTSGIYTDNYVANNGCDSTIITDLTVSPSSMYEYDAAVCQGDCEQVGVEIFCNSGQHEVLFENGAANGCDSIVTLNLTVLDPVAVAFDPAPLTCFNISTLIDASPSTSSPGIVSYSWTGPSSACFLSGQNTSTPVVNCPGIYTMTLVQILNGTTCSSTVTVEVIDAAILPNAEAGEDQYIDCNSSCVVLNSAGSDTGPSISITWTGPDDYTSNETTPVVCVPGIYTLTVFNAATGCLNTDQVVVGGDTTPPDIEATVSGLLTCIETEVTLDGSGSSGSGNLDFDWFDSTNDSIGTGSQINVSNSGIYTLIITDDANGCTAEMDVLVVENTTEPIAVASAPDSLDCTDSAVTVNGSGSSGSGTISYEWQNTNGDSLGNEVTNEVTEPGIYILIITDDANGCTSSTSVEVIEDAETPSADAMVSGLLTCTDVSVLLDGSGSSGNGSISYEWQNAVGDSLGNEVNMDIGLPGTYTLIVTNDNNGCTAETTIDVEENVDEPQPDIISDGLLTCIDGEVTLDGGGSTGQGMISYEWQDINGDSIGNGETVDVTDATTYTLIITDDANGCTAEMAFDVEENTTAPDPVASIDDLLTCSQTSVTIDGVGSSGEGTISYEWFDENGTSLGINDTLDVSDTNNYTLIITDDANGCTADTTINAAEDITPPDADAGENEFLTCTDTETTLDGGNSSTGPDYTYEWINEGNVTVGTDITVDVSETGTYTLIVTDETNGCTASSTVDVEPDADLPTADAGNGAILNCIVDMVNLDGSDSSSGTNISYEWFDPNNDSIGADPQVDVTLPGTYILVVTNTDNGCTATSSVEVSEDLTPPQANAGDPATLTCEDTEVVISGAGSTGGDLTFEWQDENTTIVGMGQDLNTSDPGTYTLIVTNQLNGCTDSDVVEVDEDVEDPIADAGPDGLLTCSETNVTLDGSGSSGGTLEFEWQNSNGDILGDLSTQDANEPDIYTLIITNTDNGCTASQTVEVLEDITAPSPDAGLDQLLNCSISEVTIDGSGSTGGTLEYEWQYEDETVISTNSSTNVDTVGIYTLIITNTDNGCTASETVVVTGDYASPQIDPGPEGLLTCADTLFTLDGSASSGNGTLDFEWQDENGSVISNMVDVEVDMPGDYTLVITDQSNGCTSTATVQVDENTIPPSADAGLDASLTCDQTFVTLTGSGSAQSGDESYLWLNSGGIEVGSTPSVQVSQTGIYTLIVFDNQNGCSASSTVEVVPDANLPIANAGLSFTLTCTETEATLDGSDSSQGANISYEWQDPNGTSISDLDITQTTLPGIYTIIVTDINNGCSSTASVEILQDIEPPVADAGLNATLTCSDTEIILDGGNSTVSSGVISSYEWFNENGDLISFFALADVTEAGTYTLVITGSNGCTDTDEVEVMLDSSIPVAETGPGGLLTCEELIITLGDANTNNGLNVSYQWTDSNGSNIGSNSTLDVTGPDTYTLIVTNLDNDCETTAQIQILQDITPPIADAGLDETLTCVLTQYELGGAGTSSGPDFTYEWQNGIGQVISDQINPVISDPDIYTLIVTNQNNACTSEATIIVDQDIVAPVADAGTDGILTCDVTEIILDGSNSSGTNISFNWENESGVQVGTTPTVQVSETGTFTLIVTNDTNGCTSTSTTTVTPDANLPSAIADPDGILTCQIGMVNLDGSASTSISGNTSFEWNDDLGNFISDQSSIDVSTPGIYVLIITDEDNGCSATTSIEVEQDITIPTADAGINQTLICGQTDVTLTGAGGNGNNLTYEWQDDLSNVIGNTATINVSDAGTYILIVTNQDNGCSSSSSVDVIPDMNLPTANAGITSTLTCDNTLVTLDGSASSQGPNFQYEWQDELGLVISTDLIFEVSTPGTYTLFVLNTDNNCESEAQVFIDQDITPPTAFADFGSATSLDCNNTTLILDGSASQPFGSLTFFWTTNDGDIISDEDTFNPEIGEAGTYTLLVTNTLNGCTDTEVITVDQDITPPIVSIQNPDILTCITTEITIDATGSSQNGNFSYEWTGNGIISGQNTLQPVINLPGTIICFIVDADNGCTSQGSITIEQDIEAPDAVATVDDQFDCITESVSLSGMGSSTGAGISYLWTGNGQIDNETSLNPTVYIAGNYTLIVTDASNGCTQSVDLTVDEDTNVPNAADIFIEAPQCFGDDGNISVFEVFGGVGPYLYSLDGGQNFTSQNLFTNLDPGSYDLVIQDANGCEFEEQLNIQTPIEVDVATEPDVLIDLGDDYQIQAIVNIPLDEIDTIIWSPTEGLSCTDCLNPTVDINRISIYTITVINENGCADTDTIILRVRKNRDVFIPNAFTPDNDGINDVLMVFAGGDQVKEVTTFQVFDRWGELVFEEHNFQPNDPAFGWDGRLREENLNPGVFVYWAKVEFIDGETFLFKGDVTLVR